MPARSEREPAYGGMRPARIFSSVDFPEPLGPTRPAWSPSNHPSVRSSKSDRAPYALLTRSQLSSSDRDIERYFFVVFLGFFFSFCMLLPFAMTLTPSPQRDLTAATTVYRHDSLREPHRVELLVQEVAGRDRPAAQPRAVDHDPVPHQRVDEVHFLVVQPLLEGAEVAAPFIRVGRPRLLRVQLVHHGVLVATEVHRRRREIPVQVHVRLDDGVARGVGRHLVLTILLHLQPGGRLEHDLLDVDADLPPLVDEPDADRLVRLRHGAVGEG